MRLPLVPTLAGLCLASPLLAMEDADMVGPRAVGMGGSNVASACDALAQWHNPAALGFMSRDPDDPRAPGNRKKHDKDVIAACDNQELGLKSWGWNLVDATAGYTLTGKLGEYLDTLGELDYDSLQNTTSLTINQVQDLVAIAANLGGVRDPKNAVLAQFNAGSSMRIGHFALGARVFGQAIARVDNIDLVNLGLGGWNADQFTSQVATTARGDAAFMGSTWTPRTLSAAQIETLRTQMDPGAPNPDFNLAINYIDYQMTRAIQDGTIQASDVDQAVAILADIARASNGTAVGSGGSFSQNTSAVLVRGFALAEIPVSYGHAFTDWLSVGITAKLMHGRVTGTSVFVFDDDAGNVDTIFSNIEEAQQQTTTFGIDAGIQFRLPMLQVGVVGRNLNSPRFDGFNKTVDLKTGNGTRQVTIDVDDVVIKPQVSIGAAFVPWNWLVLEGKADLLKTTTILDDYETQRVSLGLELDPIRILELRLGCYKNLAEDDQSLVITGGLGLDLGLLRIDLSGAVSPFDSVTYDGNEYPEEARVSLGVNLDF